MPKCPKGEKRPADVIGNAAKVMRIAVGEDMARTDRLIADVSSQGTKIDGIRMKFAWVAGGAATVGFLMAVALATIKLLPFGGQ